MEMEMLAFLLGFFVVMWAMEHPEWFVRQKSGRVVPDEDDWIHSVTRRYADPIDDFRAGYIDVREYTARMCALKRYIDMREIEPLIGSAFANHERIVRAQLATK